MNTNAPNKGCTRMHTQQRWTQTQDMTLNANENTPDVNQRTH